MRPKEQGVQTPMLNLQPEAIIKRVEFMFAQSYNLLWFYYNFGGSLCKHKAFKEVFCNSISICR